MFVYAGGAEQDGRGDTLAVTSLGRVEGTERVSRGGRRYVAWEGIPYATPPLGALRFAEPQPRAAWTPSIWRANTTHACLQVNHDPQHTQMHTPPLTGSEDCLYLNVYTPARVAGRPDTGPLPVLVHIHGGAFMFGSGALYGADNLMDRDLVYVTFNYRLGVLGFLATGDQASPGNLGLKDQACALRWLRTELRAFGGDPARVTITGLSAGGASVHMHTLSELSRGTFSRAMSLSGTALANWAVVERPEERARALGQAIGCGDVDTHALVRCLRERPAAELVLTAKRRFQPWLYNPYTPWGPVVEPPGTPRPFLEDAPYRLLASGRTLHRDVPWLTGLTTHEGLYPAAEFLYDTEHLPRLERDWPTLAPHVLHFEDTVPPGDTLASIAARIRHEYLGDRPIERDTFPDLVRMVGDRLFVAEAEVAARMHARASRAPVHAYVFAWRGSHSTSELLAHDTADHGVCHADDVMYVLHPPAYWYTEYLSTERDVHMCEKLLDTWHVFARDGRAQFGDALWLPVDPDAEDFTYLHIGAPDEAETRRAPHLGNRPFWQELGLLENENLPEAPPSLHTDEL